MKFVKWFEEIGAQDVGLVGGKNASLGEMIRNLANKGISVPSGFAITVQGYKDMIEQAGIGPKIREALTGLDTRNMRNLAERGEKIRNLIARSPFPEGLEDEIRICYHKMEEKFGKNVDVAVRSSATAEDLPTASFAGQQETYLNVRGEDDVLQKVTECFASLFTNRAISYRVDKGFDHLSVYLSVGVQKMIRSDLASSGVVFSIDTDSGFRDVVYITGAYGLGESVVQGFVDPDQFYVFKPTLKKGFRPILEKKLGKKGQKLVYREDEAGTVQKEVTVEKQRKFALTDDEIMTLAKWACTIEDHYGVPMDIEIEKFENGQILVTEMTDPDWEPILKVAGGIITNKGGRTCHAAIVSRELGVPCVISTGNGTEVLKGMKEVTIDCSQGEGCVYEGKLRYRIDEVEVSKLPRPNTKIMMNCSMPDSAFIQSRTPNDGVGLAREEFIINSYIGIHPMALIEYDKLKKAASGDEKLADVIREIDEKSAAYADKQKFFIDNLAMGIAKIAAGFYPNDVVVRFSDFKTNEYANLIGGYIYEPQESNPMIGWRGASRYYDEKFRPAFGLECQAIKKVRDEMGLTNVKTMVPFCRTPEEGRQVIEAMADFGLKQGKNGLEVYVMCEIPSNVILAEQFADVFDGFSIGSNDLTQLTLGLDRDSELVAHIFDERNEAVKRLVKQVIDAAHRHKPRRKIGICGQAPSDFPEFADYLVRCGIDSMSLNPDVALSTRLNIAEVEKRIKSRARRKRE
jgi:pyruvate,water dikinase